MDPKRIQEVAWIGQDYVKGKIRGVILTFHGLGGGLKAGVGTEELEWSNRGGLVVYPYCGPWSWMNRPARRMVDELVEAIYQKFKLSDRIPLISIGGSMGGQATLLYTRYAKRPVRACFANYPVCDLKYHFHERPDLPPTIRQALQWPPEAELDAMLAEHSPMCQIAAMPDIPYRIVHGDVDKAVSKTHHSDKFVAAMRKRKLNVKYVEVPGMGHGGPVPLEVFADNITFVTSALTGK